MDKESKKNLQYFIRACEFDWHKAMIKAVRVEGIDDMWFRWWWYLISRNAKRIRKYSTDVMKILKT